MLFQQAETAEVAASTVQMLGAGGFGAIIGWYVYYINRYRKGDVSFSDLTTVLGIIGGGLVVSLFPAQTDLFGAYGIGLFAGFFGYYIVLAISVQISQNFNVDWFLDGRRRTPAAGWEIPDTVRKTVGAMDAGGERSDEFD
ncbi:MAG: hypothetical protein KDE51_25560 [Anaerolineales bacterium]|nr:hypothetical protein [Anaerolineales bacterium]